VIYLQVVNRGVELQWNDLITGRSWRFLDMPQNAPVIPAANGWKVVPIDVLETPTGFFRARIFEPGERK